MLMAELTAMRRWLTLANIAISGGQESETTCSLQLSLGQIIIGKTPAGWKGNCSCPRLKVLSSNYYKEQVVSDWPPGMAMLNIYLGKNTSWLKREIVDVNCPRLNCKEQVVSDPFLPRWNKIPTLVTVFFSMAALIKHQNMIFCSF